MGGEWKRTTIDELCRSNIADIQTGPFGSQLHAHDYTGFGVPVVPTEAIRNRRIDHSVLPRISEEKANSLARHRLVEGDILFARRGAQATGHVAYVGKEEQSFICGTGAIRLRLNTRQQRVRSDFLSHVIASPVSLAWFKFHAIGATMPNLNEGIVRSFPLDLPPVAEQALIAGLLSALDDKIELNRRMAETLETMARSLFNSWFVDFDPVRAHAERRTTSLPNNLAALFPDSFGGDAFPEGWVALAGDVGYVVRVPVEPQHIDPGTPYVGLEHLERGSLVIRQSGSAADVDSLKTSFRRGDLLFGKLRPYFNKVAIAPFDGICSSDILVFRPCEGVPSAFLYLCFSEPAFVAAASNASSGTRMPRADWAYMRRLPTALPPPALLHAFREASTPLLSGMLSSATQSRTLAALRDTMLPKLISGELRITDALQRVAAA